MNAAAGARVSFGRPLRAPSWRRPAAVRLHEGEYEHLHELSVDAKGALRELIWKLDNVELTTVGIDIGSSTSHLMFAKVKLQRKAQHLSSQFVVVDRQVLWRSPILLTPFLEDQRIDAAALGTFVQGCYREAGLAPADIDSGAVILTGEAIKKVNAKAIAELFAAEAGKFVCATAGHHLECVLAAHGSGAVALSRQERLAVLHVDIGGGTTKLALVRDGTILATAALAVGGRVLAFAGDGCLVRMDDSARLAAQVTGARLRLGEAPHPDAVDAVVGALADALIATLRREPPQGLAEALRLTPALIDATAHDVITFSGGVAEYIFGRESRGFGDIARALGARIDEAAHDGRLRAAARDPGQGIRATVIGASQFSVQVSGKTIHLPARLDLPLHNVAVLAPDLPLEHVVCPETVAARISAAVAFSGHDAEGPLALAVRWRGDPHYARLRALAEAIALGFAGPATTAPLVILVDHDVARTLGQILEHELRCARPVVVIDGMALSELDYVDVGRLIEPAHVVPVVVKSLLFGSGQHYLRRRT